ncbi:MAG: hypothetical protein MK116_09365 [Phycisphaerales bacterium]|nr:hypothetical protein [Phycisphaerales bacterium]
MHTDSRRNRAIWPLGPIPFPVEAARRLRRNAQVIHEMTGRTARTLADRRMHVLARRLGCLGHFELDGDEPTAA